MLGWAPFVASVCKCVYLEGTSTPTEERSCGQNQFPASQPRCNIPGAKSNEISLLLIKLFHKVCAAHTHLHTPRSTRKLRGYVCVHTISWACRLCTMVQQTAFLGQNLNDFDLVVSELVWPSKMQINSSHRWGHIRANSCWSQLFACEIIYNEIWIFKN